MTARPEQDGPAEGGPMTHDRAELGTAESGTADQGTAGGGTGGGTGGGPEIRDRTGDGPAGGDRARGGTASGPGAPLVLRSHLKGDAASEAVYSPCERYRYLLTRTWDPGGRRALFVMLNPSTATELQNDPTVERCERRARALGYGAFRVTNIFAWRDTDPRAMRAAADPVGPGNDAAIRDSAPWADTVIAAWGTHGAHLGRGKAVEALLRGAGVPLQVLGLTQAGHPMHPLYIPYDRQPVPWPAG